MAATDPYQLKPRTALQSFSPWSQPFQSNIWSMPQQTTKAAPSDFFGTTPEAGASFNQFRLPKIPGLDKIIEDRSKQVGTESSLAAEDIAAYRAATKETQPEAQAAQRGDASEIGRLFAPGGYEAQLAEIRARRKSALEGVENILLGDMRRGLSLGAIGRGATGLTSYLGRQAAAQGGRIRAQAVADMAEQERKDAADVAAARAGATGRRQAGLDALINRLIAPTTAAGQIGRLTDAQIAAVLAQAIANSEIGYSVGDYTPTTLPDWGV